MNCLDYCQTVNVAEGRFHEGAGSFLYQTALPTSHLFRVPLYYIWHHPCRTVKKYLIFQLCLMNEPILVEVVFRVWIRFCL